MEADGPFGARFASRACGKQGHAQLASARDGTLDSVDILLGPLCGEVGVGVVEGVQGAVMGDKHCSLLVVGEVVDRDPDPT
jgi:hypothetical protein